MQQNEKQKINQKENYDVLTFRELYSISHSKFYEEVRKGRLKIIKIGRRTYVPRKHAEAWFQNLIDNISK